MTELCRNDRITSIDAAAPVDKELAMGDAVSVPVEAHAHVNGFGTEYYEYLLLYSDGALCISENAEAVLRTAISQYFPLKEKSIGPPKVYLGGHVRKVQLENGVECWAFGSSQYVKSAVTYVEAYLTKQTKLLNSKWKLPTKAETPMQTSYRPELDVSPELEPTEAAYYQSLIGVLRWMVELGRVDIAWNAPCCRHTWLYQGKDTSIRCFNTELVFDPSDPYVEESNFELKDWTSSEFGHLQGDEELPPNMPQPRGLGFIMSAKVDADHASDTVTRGLKDWVPCTPELGFDLLVFPQTEQCGVE